jgi:hypothetical protein
MQQFVVTPFDVPSEQELAQNLLVPVDDVTFYFNTKNKDKIVLNV